RTLPPDYGNSNNVNRRFKGIWEGLLKALIDRHDYERLMIDANIKAHPDAAGTVSGEQDIERTKGDSISRYILPWMRMAVGQIFFITAATVAHCKKRFVF
ncbi:MAG: IS5/IS1182 family transposase, partial [Clostridia bacterium]